MYLAVQKIKTNYNIEKKIILDFVGAVSSGIVENNPILDLDYKEDSVAQVDANFVICGNGNVSEIQVTGEEYSFSVEQYNNIFELAKQGIKEIINQQKKAVA